MDPPFLGLALFWLVVVPFFPFLSPGIHSFLFSFFLSPPLSPFAFPFSSRDFPLDFFFFFPFPFPFDFITTSFLPPLPRLRFVASFIRDFLSDLRDLFSLVHSFGNLFRSLEPRIDCDSFFS